MRVPYTTLLLLGLTALSSCSLSNVQEPNSREATGSREVRGNVASADGVPIAYWATSEREIALVFIHCGFCDASFWSEQVDAFRDDYRVVRLDLAGHGESGSDRKTWTLPAFGEDVKAVVETLNLDRVLLIGNSLGGPVALAAGQLMPDQVIGLIAVDTLQNVDVEFDQEGWLRRTERFRRDFVRACNGMVDQLFHGDADPQLVARIRSEMCDVSPDIAISIFEGLNSYDAGAEMMAVKAPIRAINSDLFPTNVEGNRKYAPGFEAVVMEGVGHFPQLEQPEAFNRHLTDLVTGIVNR